MRKLLLSAACLLMLTGAKALAADFETAKDAVKNMGLGWNLGNTLDANDGTRKPDVVASETCWGQPVTKPELMLLMRDAGFGAIRVPVTWYPHMNEAGTVDEAWMKRVHEVVDYVLDAGLYCILNVHHDTGAADHAWLIADEDNYAKTKDRYEGLWKQIAEEFKDYGDKLLFEAYNEMLDSKRSWCFASFAAQGQWDAAIAKSAYAAINSYAQSFVDVVRASGGNNASRNLIVNTYAAACGSGNWNSHLKDPLTELNLPTDITENHLIFEVHNYPTIENGLDNAKKELDATMESLKTHLVAKGAPVIIGEWGTSNVDNGGDYANRRADMIEFLDYFVKKAKENDMATFYWMGLSDGAARSLAVFNQADLAETIAKAYHGSNYQGKWPSMDDLELEYIVKYTGDWQELNLYSGAALKVSEYKAIRLELTEMPAANALQIKVYGDVVNNSAKEGYYPLEKEGLNTTVTFNSSQTGETITRITLQTAVGATEAKVSRAVLIKSDNTEEETELSVFWGCTLESQVKQPTAIYTPKTATTADDNIYNLAGQRVTSPRKGIYIRNGKKYAVK